MPTASGQFQLQDYIAELNNRGFSGFSPADQIELVNRGYRRIARKTRWRWEQGTLAFTLNPGDSFYDLTVNPTFNTLQELYVTTANQRRKLKLMNEQVFLQQVADDLTLTTARGEPDSYRIFNHRIYVLPPPQTTRDFLAYLTQRVVKLVNTTDVPVTPPDYDEAIMMATLIGAHERAQEFDIAGGLRGELNEFFDDELDREVFETEEEQERVIPDNTWL
jgi:hypothetical protein